MGLIHQLYVIRKMIGNKGMECTFNRTEKNDFGEMTNNKEILTCKGIFHQSNQFIGISLVDAGKLSTVKKPMLLILYNELIKSGDLVNIGGNDYRVSGLDDLGHLHICLDVSLEVV